MSGCDGNEPSALQTSDTANAKEMVLEFYKLALEDMKPRDAFNRYAADNFIEHAQSATGTAEGTLASWKR